VWQFESNTAEGWTFDVALAGAQHAGVGTPTASSALANSGTYSLAIQFEGEGVGGRNTVFVRVPLCAGGQAVDLNTKTWLTAKVRLVTAVGSQPLYGGMGHSIRLYSGTQGSESYDFSVDDSTGGGPLPGSWYDAGGNIYQGWGSTFPSAVTAIGFRFLVSHPWKGTVYLDDVAIY
jgi:hypothetical protein